MFKWPGTPSSRPPEHELADYAELVCWEQGSTSMNTLSADLGRLEENDYSGGVSEEEDTLDLGRLDAKDYSGGVPEEEKVPQIVEEAYLEIERRKEACRDGYPFIVGEQGYTLYDSQESENHKHIIYKYLLLATRLNMNDNREHADIDGSLLLEKLAAEAARDYLGARAESIVFGTAGGSDFQGKINDLCKRIKEGDGYVNRNEAPPNERDGKLDVVAWKHFADRLPGKLIAFGQCKTGTNYKDTLTQLQPDSFCKKWLRSPLVLTPMRMFFVAEALSRSRWANTSYDAGLLFDRCRIVDFCGGISGDVLKKVTTWTEAAAKGNELPGQ